MEGGDDGSASERTVEPSLRSSRTSVALEGSIFMLGEKVNEFLDELEVRGGWMRVT